MRTWDSIVASIFLRNWSSVSDCASASLPPSSFSTRICSSQNTSTVRTHPLAKFPEDLTPSNTFGTHAQAIAQSILLWERELCLVHHAVMCLVHCK